MHPLHPLRLATEGWCIHYILFASQRKDGCIHHILFTSRLRQACYVCYDILHLLASRQPDVHNYKILLVYSRARVLQHCRRNSAIISRFIHTYPLRGRERQSISTHMIRRIHLVAFTGHDGEIWEEQGPLRQQPGQLAFRTVQLVVALVVIGLYSVDLNRANKVHEYSNSKWVRMHETGLSTASTKGHERRCQAERSPILTRNVFPQVYVVVVGSMSAISAVILGLLSVWVPYKAVAIPFFWSLTLTVLWAAVSGIFGLMYLHETEMESGMSHYSSDDYRIKVAVGFDLSGMVL